MKIKSFDLKYIFLYVQITEPVRFLLGRETKFELNSLAPGFSFDFHQIKLQEKKLLLKTREVKEPWGKYHLESELEIKSRRKRVTRMTTMKISRQRYPKIRIFTCDTKMTKIVNGIILWINIFLDQREKPEIGESFEITILSPGDLSPHPGPRGPSITRKRDRTKSP